MTDVRKVRAVEYVRLFADELGESHFEDVPVQLTPRGFAPPAPPLHISEFQDAHRFAFLGAPVGWFGDWHPAPARQFLVVLAGALEVEAGDGETRHFGAGSVLLVEDTTGRGHRTRVLGDVEPTVAVVQL